MEAFLNTPWQKAQLLEICAPKTLVNPRKEIPKSYFTYVDISSVSNGTFEIKEPKRILGEQAPTRARKRIQKGDIILATTRPYLRSIALISEAFDGAICSTGFCVLRPTEKVLSEWLFYCVISDDFINQLIPLMRGANYPAVTDNDVLSMSIPLPPLPEQRRIVARINEMMARVDEIRKLREEIMRKERLLSNSILTKAFSGEL